MAAGGSHEGEALLEALRHGDEAAFRALVDALDGRMLRLARSVVRTEESAREVVQDTWLAVIEGLDRFEGRSALRSWIFSILMNRARTRAGREWRLVPVSPIGTDEDGPLLDPGLFDGPWLRPDALRWDPPDPERAAASRELLAQVEKAIEALPERQRAVLLLHDVEGLDAAEVCNLMQLSETNQRVLLHRARVRVREALERRLGDGGAGDDGGAGGER